jgi:hypothetical protein
MSTPEFGTSRVFHLFVTTTPFSGNTESRTIQRSTVLAPISDIRLEETSGLQDSKVFSTSIHVTSEIKKAETTDLMVLINHR